MEKKDIVVALSYGFLPKSQSLPRMSIAGLEEAAQRMKEYQNTVMILTSAGFEYCKPEYEARIAELKKVGVDETKISKARPSISTIDEAEAAKEVAAKRTTDVGKLILIADKDHIKRSCFIFEKVFPGTPIWPITTSSPLDHDNPLLPLKYRPVWWAFNAGTLFLMRIFGMEKFRNLAHPHPGEK